jgi:hypothetical protein
MAKNKTTPILLLFFAILISLVILAFLLPSDVIQKDMPDSINPPEIEIDELGPEYFVGDEFLASGNTTLAEGEKIRVLFYQNAFVHGRIRPDKTSIEAVTEVKSGKSGVNRWSAVINTTGFWPGECILTAYSNKSWKINASQKITLIDRNSL